MWLMKTLLTSGCTNQRGAGHRIHIDHRCRHLLIARFFLTEYGVSLSTLRSSFDKLHNEMSVAYGLACGPKDFEEALCILEGSFINITNINGPIVTYINPSLKDYLSAYLLDTDLLIRLIPATASIDWISRLWNFVHPRGLRETDRVRIAKACVSILDMFETRPHWRPKIDDARILEYNDAANSRRLRILMDWWQLTNERKFADSLMAIARNPPQGFSAWSDGETLIDFFSRRGERGSGRPFIYETELLELLEKELTEAIRWSPSDMLPTFVDAVDATEGLPDSVIYALQAAVLEDFEENTSRICEDNSEFSLSDRIDTLKKLATRFDVSEDVLNRAISAIEERISEIEEQSSCECAPGYSSLKESEQDTFDDSALHDLFITLLDG